MDLAFAIDDDGIDEQDVVGGELFVALQNIVADKKVSLDSGVT